VALGARGGLTLRVVERELVVKGRKSRAFRIEQPDGTREGGTMTAIDCAGYRVPGVGRRP
jgi:hypothetical protein